MSSYLVYERKTQIYLAVESVRVVESMTVVESVRVVESMRARQINGGDIPETIYLFLRIVFSIWLLRVLSDTKGIHSVVIELFKEFPFLYFNRFKFCRHLCKQLSES